MFQTFIEYNAPSDWSKGRDYEKTLIGSILGLSPILEPQKTSDLFTNPSTTSKQEHDITEKNIWQVSIYYEYKSIHVLWKYYIFVGMVDLFCFYFI